MFFHTGGQADQCHPLLSGAVFAFRNTKAAWEIKVQSSLHVNESPSHPTHKFSASSANSAVKNICPYVLANVTTISLTLCVSLLLGGLASKVQRSNSSCQTRATRVSVRGSPDGDSIFDNMNVITPRSPPRLAPQGPAACAAGLSEKRGPKT